MNNNRNDEQEPIIEEIINSDFNGLLLLPTGTGKTRIIIEALKREHKRFKSILWVCATETARDVTTKEEFIKWKAKSVLNKVHFICWSSLKNYKGIHDLYILDEVQMITKNNVKYFNWFTISLPKIIALTGTYPRDREKHEILNNKLKLSKIWELKVDNAVEKLLISDYNVTVVNVDINNVRKIEIINKTNKSKFFKTEAESYDWYTREISMSSGLRKKNLSLGRARLLYNSITKAEAARKIINKFSKDRLISFSKSTKIADFIGSNPFHSKLDKKTRSKNYDDFNNEVKRHINTVEAANTSLNFKNIEVLFIQQLDSNPANYLQRMGRGLRFRDNYIANIIILCMRNTQDEVWVNECISSLNPEKVRFMELNDFLNE